MTAAASPPFFCKFITPAYRRGLDDRDITFRITPAWVAGVYVISADLVGSAVSRRVYSRERALNKYLSDPRGMTTGSHLVLGAITPALE